MIDNDLKKLTPSFLIYLDGVRLPIEQEASIKKITIDERIDSYSKFRIEMADINKEWIDDDTLSPGGEIKISLGYKDDLKQIIWGEITGLAAYFDRYNGCSLVIQGCDHLHRLIRAMESRSFTNMNDADIVKQIASEVQLSCDVEEVGVDKPFTMQRDETNFEYLMALAERHDCNLWVRDKKLYFKKLPMNLTEDVILELGKTLIEICPCADVRRLITEVEVRGWDNSKGKAVVGSAVIDDIDGKGGKIVKENFGDQKEIRIDPTVHDIKRAEELARNILTQNARKYITGTGMARGDTEIRARSIIKVNGIGKKFSNKYYIQCTRHILNANGYTTYFYFTTYIGTEGAKGIGGSDTNERVVFEEPKRKESYEKSENSSLLKFYVPNEKAIIPVVAAGHVDNDDKGEKIAILTNGTLFDLADGKPKLRPIEYFMTKSGKFDSDQSATEIASIIGCDKGAFAEWDGGNTKKAREDAINEIFGNIKDNYIIEDIFTLIGHSHGGNVMIMVANKLKKAGYNVAKVISLNAPVREYFIRDDSIPLTHTFSLDDWVQRVGTIDTDRLKRNILMKGSIELPWGRHKIKYANNIEIDSFFDKRSEFLYEQINNYRKSPCYQHQITRSIEFFTKIF